jgi:hypothetical protein
MTDAQQVADRYIAAWNETNSERRMALLGQHWNADASYVDPMASVAGVSDINKLIASVQERFPGFWVFSTRSRNPRRSPAGPSALIALMLAATARERPGRALLRARHCPRVGQCPMGAKEWGAKARP